MKAFTASTGRRLLRRLAAARVAGSAVPVATLHPSRWQTEAVRPGGSLPVSSRKLPLGASVPRGLFGNLSMQPDCRPAASISTRPRVAARAALCVPTKSAFPLFMEGT